MFGRPVTLFRLFGFAVRLDASWLIIAALVAWSLAAGFFPYHYPGLTAATYWWMGGAGALGLFFSIVFHELFHSLVARRYGIPMRGITLFVFGGIAEMEREPPDAKSEFFMAIVGPLASIGLGGLFYLLEHATYWSMSTGAVIAYLAWINWLLAAFNLIPAFPLDGGRVLRAALWRFRGNLPQATRTASAVGQAFGVVLIVLGVFRLFTGDFISAVWWFLLGMFLRQAAQSSYQQVVMRNALEGEAVRRIMRPDPVAVSPELSVEHLVDEYVYRYHHKMFPVTGGSRELLGCVNTEDIKAVPREEWSGRTVGSIMRTCSGQNTIAAGADAATAFSILTASDGTKLMVTENDRVVGIITSRDLLQFLSSKLELEGPAPLSKTAGR